MNDDEFDFEFSNKVGLIWWIISQDNEIYIDRQIIKSILILV